eukprot:492468-Pleurochrysis_carterae.AAC.1
MCGPRLQYELALQARPARVSRVQRSGVASRAAGRSPAGPWRGRGRRTGGARAGPCGRAQSPPPPRSRRSPTG